MIKLTIEWWINDNKQKSKVEYLADETTVKYRIRSYCEAYDILGFVNKDDLPDNKNTIMLRNIHNEGENILLTAVQEITLK